MKKQLTQKTALSVMLVLFTAFNLFAAQITVSNDPNRVAQYTNLQTAINDAQFGDTLLVYGSTTDYGAISLFKPLVLIGEGYNSANGLISTMSTLTIGRSSSTVSGSGSTIMGFNFTNGITMNADFSGATAGQRVLENITVLRCRIQNTVNIGNQTSSAENFSNVRFFNVLFVGGFATSVVNLNFGASATTTDQLDITFANNIFQRTTITSLLNRSSGVLGTFQSLENVKFYNNIFLNDNTGLLTNTVGIVFEDNIFFGHQLYSGDYAQITWNNNLFYLVDQVTNLFTRDNVGSGNLINVNPNFVNYPATPTNFSFAHDYNLQAGSPALTAALDGGQIGIYGGAYPFAVGARPPVPIVTEVTIQDGTSSVPVGGTINFNFKAQSGN